MDSADAPFSHAQKDLPNYAVPLFLRIVSQAALNSMGIKQDKIQPKDEGVNPSRVRGDRLYVLRGNRYTEFKAADWDDLSQARARL